MKMFAILKDIFRLQDLLTVRDGPDGLIPFLHSLPVKLHR